MDQGRKFSVHEIGAWQGEKDIKIELSVWYSPEMNGIAKRTKSLIVIKTSWFLQESNLNNSFWPSTFKTAIYLLNQTLSSTLDYDISLETWLREYRSHNHNFTQAPSHLRT